MGEPRIAAAPSVHFERADGVPLGLPLRGDLAPDQFICGVAAAMRHTGRALPSDITDAILTLELARK